MSRFRYLEGAATKGDYTFEGLVNKSITLGSGQSQGSTQRVGSWHYDWSYDRDAKVNDKIS
jgi:hypothetical protein